MWFRISKQTTYLILIVGKLAGPQRSHLWLGEVWIACASCG